MGMIRDAINRNELLSAVAYNPGNVFLKFFSMLFSDQVLPAPDNKKDVNVILGISICPN